MRNRIKSVGVAGLIALAVLSGAEAEELLFLAPPSQSSGKPSSAPLPPPLPKPQIEAPANAPRPISVAPLVEKPASIETLPQIAAPSRPDLAPILDGINLPGIVSALLADKGADLVDMRDVRRYVFSLYKGMAEACGPHGDEASLDALGYVEPGLGPGRNAGEVGARIGMKLLLDLAEVSRTGDVNTYLRNSTSEAPQVTEGKEDGQLISSRLGCGTSEYRSLRDAIERLMKAKTGTDPQPHDQLALASLMSPSFRKKNGIEDPAVTIRNMKLKEAVNQVRQACVAKYDSKSFCDCLLRRLKDDKLEDADWSTIGFRFSNIIQVATQKPVIANTIRTCLRE